MIALVAISAARPIAPRVTSQYVIYAPNDSSTSIRATHDPLDSTHILRNDLNDANPRIILIALMNPIPQITEPRADHGAPEFLDLSGVGGEGGAPGDGDPVGGGGVVE